MEGVYQKMKTKITKVPPDLEGEKGMNKKRAAWAGMAITAFIAATRTDREDSLADLLLCDMAHWCDRNGFDMEANIARARRFYHEETCGKGSQLR